VFLPLLVALLMMVIKALHSVWQLVLFVRKSA